MHALCCIPFKSENAGNSFCGWNSAKRLNITKFRNPKNVILQRCRCHTNMVAPKEIKDKH